MLVDDVKIYFLMFFLFCMIGWVWESIYMSVIEKRIQSRGFLFGPYIPLYGFAGIIMNFTLGRLYGPFLSINTVVIYLLGIVCATTLELITSTLAERYLHRQLWDYSIYKINYKGKICLIASLFWGVAAVTFVQLLNPLIVLLFSRFGNQARLAMVIIMAVIMGIDTIISFGRYTPVPAKLAGVKERILNKEEV